MLKRKGINAYKRLLIKRKIKTFPKRLKKIFGFGLLYFSKWLIEIRQFSSNFSRNVFSSIKKGLTFTFRLAMNFFSLWYSKSFSLFDKRTHNDRLYLIFYHKPSFFHMQAVLNHPLQNPELDQPQGLLTIDVERKQTLGLRIHLRGRAITREYANAMVHFCLSPLAFPYLSVEGETQGISYSNFGEILQEKWQKKKSLRKMLVIEERDSVRMRAWKIVFKSLCQVFLEKFCVGWILVGKMADKMAYFKYRGKMLRMLETPQRLRV